MDSNLTRKMGKSRFFYKINKKYVKKILLNIKLFDILIMKSDISDIQMVVKVEDDNEKKSISIPGIPDFSTSSIPGYLPGKSSNITLIH